MFSVSNCEQLAIEDCKEQPRSPIIYRQFPGLEKIETLMWNSKDLLLVSEDLSSSRGEGVEKIDFRGVPFPCEIASHLGLIDGVDIAKSQALVMDEGLEKRESWEGERGDEAKVRRDGRAAMVAKEEEAATME
ncbi:hypothetical protein S83_003772 [Arachis hypogaea]